MASLLGQFVRNFIFLASLVVVVAFSPGASTAAPYAAIVMDARTGETLYAKNADTRLYPASLTKMLTLYITFAAIESGEISLDTMVTVSKNAAAEPPSKLGLKAGQRIALRYLIRAAAVRSANDAATAIGDHIGGSEEKFADRMNRTAKALGMRNSTFKNANGLTREGHLSTARDMTILGRRLFYDFPQYYNLFSRRSADAGMAKVANTNRKFLDSYRGADGIKTGYTAPAGFNLTASAERGNTRIIATVFGGTSTAQRNAKMAELLDLGFASAPTNVAVQAAKAPITVADAGGAGISAGKTLRLVTTVSRSPRPKTRPRQTAPVEVAVAAMQDSIVGALAEAVAAPAAPAPAPEIQLAETTQPEIPTAETAPEVTNIATLSSAEALRPRPAAKPERLAAVIIHTATPLSAAANASPVPTAPEIVTRISTSGGRHWGVNIGRFSSRATAERALMKTMLAESATLTDGLRKIVQKSGGFDANFMGLTQDQADLACRRLQARGTQCFAIGP
ncbi:MAG: D-alanyl-D-alanine carboxypeptidase family protein [Pseudorhodobacter sp.]|nr:D-alanyl-D-alanine carboxypeptidase family protein [Pseudorhodobacter sp.]